MIRLLDDVFLLKEIDEVSLSYSSEDIRRKHADKIVIIRHSAYIYKNVLCEKAHERLTDLSDYVLLGELANHLSVDKRLLIRRIKFMEKTNTCFFEYMELRGNYYIKLCKTKQRLFQEFQPFLIELRDPKNVVHSTMLGDLAIGFY